MRAFAGRDLNGRPVQVSRTVRGSKKDAQRLAAELTLRRPTAAVARVTVAEMLDLWAETMRGTWAPQTERDQLSRIRRVKSDRIALIPLSRLTAVEVDRWHARLARQGLGEGAVRNRHVVLRAAVSLAVRWGWVPANAVAVARLGKRKSQPRGALGDDEVRAILVKVTKLVVDRQIEPQAVVALRLAAITGARRSELAALRWEDLREGRLVIDSSIVILRGGDDRRVPTLRDDPTKTANRRVVTIDEVTVSLLATLRRNYAAYGPWILAAGARPVNPERISAWWRRSRDGAGVDPKWRLHDLRHWSATTSIAGGHDIRTVANRLGHANPSMTLRTYAHAVEAADAPVARTLGRILDAVGLVGLEAVPAPGDEVVDSPRRDEDTSS